MHNKCAAFAPELIAIVRAYHAQTAEQAEIGPVRARVSARRSASGSRYRPAMRRTRSAASAAGIPAHDRYRVGSGAEPGLGHPRAPPVLRQCTSTATYTLQSGRPPVSMS